MPPMPAPVESCKYLPATLLEFAKPFGCLDDLELRSSRADSHALAARITVFAVTSYSSMSSLFTYETPVALPSLSVNTSRAMALAITSTFPVFKAGFTSTDDDEKSPYTVQPRLHCEQKKHWPRSLLIGFVRMDRREGMTGIFRAVPASLMRSSCSLGLGGGRKIPSG